MIDRVQSVMTQHRDRLLFILHSAGGKECAMFDPASEKFSEVLGIARALLTGCSSNQPWELPPCPPCSALGTMEAFLGLQLSPPQAFGAPELTPGTHCPVPTITRHISVVVAWTPLHSPCAASSRSIYKISKSAFLSDGVFFTIGLSEHVTLLPTRCAAAGRGRVGSL